MACLTQERQQERSIPLDTLIAVFQKQLTECQRLVQLLPHLHRGVLPEVTQHTCNLHLVIHGRVGFSPALDTLFELGVKVRPHLLAQLLAE